MTSLMYSHCGETQDMGIEGRIQGKDQQMCLATGYTQTHRKSLGCIKWHMPHWVLESLQVVTWD